MLAAGFEIVYDPAAAVWHVAHDPVNAFRRNRAVQSGYQLMFPELRSTAVGQAAVVARRAGQLTKERLKSRDVSGLARDVRRLAAVLASLAGGLAARLRASRSDRDETKP